MLVQIKIPSLDNACIDKYPFAGTGKDHCNKGGKPTPKTVQRYQSNINRDKPYLNHKYLIAL